MTKENHLICDLLIEAYTYAMKYSTDPSSANAALLVFEDRVLLSEANHFPNGVNDRKPERWERPLKYDYIGHAEENVIHFAARMGVRTSGLTMVCPWFACTTCARAIIQAGIISVVGHDCDQHKTRPEWVASCNIADQMFAEAGVVTYRHRQFLNTPIRFNSELVCV